MTSIYDALGDWYRLLDPPADHAEEALAFTTAIESAAALPVETLLEIGAGAGHNALHLKARFRATLSDLSPEMSRLSRELNPECEHLIGDMRALRLDRTFDAVLIHDAITYMTSEVDLAAAITTAFVHTRPGGVALFVPDAYRETFEDATDLLEEDAFGRSLRGLIWSWDPDPADTIVATEYALLLRDDKGVRSLHDQHFEGLFPIATWRALLGEAGFVVDTFPRPLGDGAFDDAWVCRRPG